MTTPTGTNTPTARQIGFGGYFFMLLGLVAISAAPILVRYAQYAGAPSLLIAGGRLIVAAVLLTPFALMNHRPALSKLSRNDLLLALGSGLFLAIHFATWIASLEYTTVLISVILVTTSPIWVAILELIFLRARPQALIVIAIGITLAGGALIGAGGVGSGSGRDALYGALLSVAGAIAYAFYLVIGRKLRSQLSLVPYIWLVYSVAAIILAAAMIVTRMPLTGYRADSYGWIVALALIPQLIGHTSINYALRYVSATYVSIATQLESVGSGIAAYFLFNEVPTVLQLLGSVAILAGVILASLAQQAHEAPVEAAEEAEAEGVAL